MLQLPAIFTPPLSENFPTDGDKLIEFANLAWQSPESPDGIHLDEWQQWLLRAILERYPDDHESFPGRLRYRQVVISVGRQNGKSLLAAILGLYGLLMHEVGPQVISLASSTDQANIVYSRVNFVINQNPFLKRRFKRATETRGIVTADNAGRYDVKAAKEAALQGIPMSLCLFDELHLAKQGMWGAAIFGTSQRKDGIVIGITTAGDQTSETLINLYKSGTAAANGAEDLERFGFFCWQAPDNAPIDDPAAIMAANPSVAAGRIPVAQVISDMKTIPEHEARRYRLNQFISGTAASWLPGNLFKAATGRGATNMTGGVFAVDITRNWEHATIAYANSNGDLQETELVASLVAPTEQQLFNEITSLYSRHSPRAIALDDRKVLGNQGASLKKFGKHIAELVAQTQGDEDMAEFINPLAKLGQQMTQFTGEIGYKAMENADEVGAAAVDYLRVAGHLVFGYFWARMAQVALQKIAEGNRDPFYQAKLQTARFYFAKLFPETASLMLTARAGSAVLMETEAVFA